MIIYNSDTDYKVYLEEDGDGLWISVSNGYCNSYDCIVGNSTEDVDIKACLNTAYAHFFPAQYIEEHLEPNANREMVLWLARDAYEIDCALEFAIDA